MDIKKKKKKVSTKKGTGQVFVELCIVSDIKGAREGGRRGWDMDEKREVHGRIKKRIKASFPALHSKRCKCESVCSSRGKILLST